MEQQKTKSVLRDLVEALVIALVIALPIKYFVASPFIVRQTSMYPTFKDGDYLIVDKVSYRFNEPKRGDIVVFEPPFSKGTYYIKRIVGLPGEKIEVKDNIVTIYNNEHPEGFVLDEKYISSQRPEHLSTQIDTNNYFVMGDNREVSSDSRNWGELSEQAISGKVLIRLFPFSNIDIHPGALE